MSEGKIFVLGMVGLLSALSFMLGVFTATFNGGCPRPSIASYFPAYWVACELFEERWKEETP